MDSSSSNNGNGGEPERKSYRKFVRPDYKPSMVSFQTNQNCRKCLFSQTLDNPVSMQEDRLPGERYMKYNV